MRNRKNKSQRHEVRRILQAVRQELQDYNLQYEDIEVSRPVIHLNEVIQRARNSDRSAEN